MQNLTIGAVAKLTRIPAHTLRKWESRHGIAKPDRTETGRRIYTQAHVEQLRLVRDLMSAGHALAHLAGLSTPELKELLGQHAEAQVATEVSGLYLIGPNVSRLLTASSPGRRAAITRYSGESSDWLTGPKDSAADENAAFVLECATLPDATFERIADLARRSAKVVVVYTFANRATLTRLQQAGIAAIPAPAHEADLIKLVDPVETESDDAPRRHRFSTEELARIASLSPGIACECPNHIAKLLMDISAFEQYSLECTDKDPQERALHEQLGNISARARALFEDALVQVAFVDGLAIKTNH